MADWTPQTKIMIHDQFLFVVYFDFCTFNLSKYVLKVRKSPQKSPVWTGELTQLNT